MLGALAYAPAALLPLAIRAEVRVRVRVNPWVRVRVNPNPNPNPNPKPKPNPSQESLQLWAALASSLEGVPLVKPIVEAKEGGLVDGLFQFKHLSFQEALSGQFLVQVAA